MILEEDESDTPEAAAVSSTVDAGADSAFEPSKPTDPSDYKLWYDVEDERFVDKDLFPIPPLEQEGSASTPTPDQDQLHSRHYSTGSVQDQISQHDNDGTKRGVSDALAPYSLLALVDGNSGRGSEEENVSKLKKYLVLAFEKYEK